MPLPVGFVLWWFEYVPIKIIYISKKLIGKAYNFFSIPILLKSLLAPWKKDEVDTSNMALDDKLRVWMMNLMSRLIGAVVRSGTIFFGLVAIIATVIGAALSLILFLAAPAVSIGFLVAGIIY